MTEGDSITSSDLEQEWQKTLEFFGGLIEDGHKLRPIRILVKHIIEQNYSQKCYPGTSLYNLLISLPAGFKIDFTRTLNINYDQIKQKVKFDYRDFRGLKRDVKNSEKALKWTTTCEATEVNDVFEYFLTQFSDWKQIKN